MENKWNFKDFIKAAGITAIVAALLLPMFIIQDIETAVSWAYVLYPLVGLIPTIMGYIFKGVVIDKSFNWWNLLYCLIFSAAMSISVTFGILLNRAAIS